MWANTQEIKDLVTFTEEIVIGKLHFLYRVEILKEKGSGLVIMCGKFKFLFDGKADFMEVAFNGLLF